MWTCRSLGIVITDATGIVRVGCDEPTELRVEIFKGGLLDGQVSSLMFDAAQTT